MADGPGEWYLSERAAMCYDAGRLRGVRYGVHADSPACVDAVLLEFEFARWMLGVDPEDDTVRVFEAGIASEIATEIVTEADLSFEDAPGGSPWTPALGMSAQWIWIMQNQQGYCDGIQFAFGLDGREVCRIQMIAAASSWRIDGRSAVVNP